MDEQFEQWAQEAMEIIEEAQANGVFFYDGEAFAVSKSQTKPWLFDVIDAEGNRVSFGLTPEVAMRNAIEDLEYVKDIVALNMEEIFGEGYWQ